MRRASLAGFTILLLAVALVICTQSVSALSNATPGTVVSVSGSTVVVETNSGNQVTLMLDGVSVVPANLRAGDRVSVRYHPIDNGHHEMVTMILESPLGVSPLGMLPKETDSDGDGVPDRRDNCPGTIGGAKVDKDGCPVVLDVKHLEMELLNTGMIELSNVNFDYDESTIRPDAYAVLDSVGRVLTKWPGLEIEIDAYTDSRGTDAYNYDLSHRRAESVRTHLLANFSEFGAAQLTAKDHGESNPLVPNTSEANMQVNRRVEFVVLNKEILERQK